MKVNVDTAVLFGVVYWHMYVRVQLFPQACYDDVVLLFVVPPFVTYRHNTYHLLTPGIIRYCTNPSSSS
jgi:hypothetical protein